MSHLAYELRRNVLNTMFVERILGGDMRLYAWTIFLSSFLLFQVQPLIGKYILPWFGSTPSVWTSSLLFFQVLLLLGYAYAHLISTRLNRRSQLVVHVSLLAVGAILLPIIPNESWRAVSGVEPTGRILTVLALTVGPQYFLVASTSPLLQAWFRDQNVSKKRSPYRLYAVSNVGSMIGLLTYPFIVEPTIDLRTQAIIWSLLFVAFVGLSVIAGRAWFRSPVTESKPDGRAISERVEAAPSIARMLKWVVLSALGSVLLLATINELTVDVPAVPFLFILPLSLYLLTFIITFDSPRWYYRPLFTLLLPVVAMTTLINPEALAPLFGKFIGGGSALQDVLIEHVAVGTLICSALFLGCMSCHGELVRSKPSTRHLTRFYLVVSFGGALGGLFVAVVAPRVFTELWEFEIGLLGAVLVVVGSVTTDLVRRARNLDGKLDLHGFVMGRKAVVVSSRIFGGIVFVLVAFVALVTLGRSDRYDPGTIELSRNFYGTLRIAEEGDGTRKMQHGSVLHGSQFVEEERHGVPTAYYGANSGVGMAITLHPNRNAGENLRIGGVGMGVGTIAAHAMPGDFVRFYEINPLVIDQAEAYFTYLSDAAERGAAVEVAEGDARLVLEKESADGVRQGFDVLAVDAFSGDSVPMHLLTREAFEIYASHLAPDGIIAFHISNNFVNLRPVVGALADEAGLTTYEIRRGKVFARGERTNVWLLASRNHAFFDQAELREIRRAVDVQPVLWTDDFSSLLAVLNF